MGYRYTVKLSTKDLNLNREVNTNDWEHARATFWTLTKHASEIIDPYTLEWINNEDNDYDTRVLISLIKI